MPGGNASISTVAPAPLQWPAVLGSPDTSLVEMGLGPSRSWKADSHEVKDTYSHSRLDKLFNTWLNTSAEMLPAVPDSCIHCRAQHPPSHKALLVRQAYGSSSPLNPSPSLVKGWGEACRSLGGLWGLASLGAAGTVQPCG